MKFTSFNEFSITSLFKLLKDCNDFHWYKCLKTIFIGTVRNNQIWIFCALNMLNKFSQQRNIEGWIVQIFVVIGGFALFFKEMGFTQIKFVCFFYVKIENPNFAHVLTIQVVAFNATIASRSWAKRIFLIKLRIYR